MECFDIDNRLAELKIEEEELKKRIEAREKCYLRYKMHGRKRGFCPDGGGFRCEACRDYQRSIDYVTVQEAEVVKARKVYEAAIASERNAAVHPTATATEIRDLPLPELLTLPVVPPRCRADIKRTEAELRKVSHVRGVHACASLLESASSATPTTLEQCLALANKYSEAAAMVRKSPNLKALAMARDEHLGGALESLRQFVSDLEDEKALATRRRYEENLLQKLDGFLLAGGLLAHAHLGGCKGPKAEGAEGEGEGELGSTALDFKSAIGKMKEWEDKVRQNVSPLLVNIFETFNKLTVDLDHLNEQLPELMDEGKVVLAGVCQLAQVKAQNLKMTCSEKAREEEESKRAESLKKAKSVLYHLEDVHKSATRVEQAEEQMNLQRSQQRVARKTLRLIQNDLDCDDLTPEERGSLEIRLAQQKALVEELGTAVDVSAQHLAIEAEAFFPEKVPTSVREHLAAAEEKAKVIERADNDQVLAAVQYEEDLKETARLNENLQSLRETNSKLMAILGPHGLIQETFYDPITKEIMRDPVLTADGHTYERASIELWFQRNGTSPMTGLPLPAKTLIPNLALKAQISCFRESVERMGVENELTEEPAPGTAEALAQWVRETTHRTNTPPPVTPTPPPLTSTPPPPVTNTPPPTEPQS